MHCFCSKSTWHKLSKLLLVNLGQNNTEAKLHQRSSTMANAGGERLCCPCAGVSVYGCIQSITHTGDVVDVR